MQGHNYSAGFDIEIRSFSQSYESWFEIKPAALLSQYNENSDTYIYWGLFYFNLETQPKQKEYRRIYGVRAKPTLPYWSYSQRFWRSKAQIKSKDIPQRFLFEQKELRHKEYELGFEIEIEKAQFKSLSVANEFVVLTPINKKSYIFAFNVFAEKNSAKIYKRVENANF